jgi:hypothetical protein
LATDETRRGGGEPRQFAHTFLIFPCAPRTGIHQC